MNAAFKVRVPVVAGQTGERLEQQKSSKRRKCDQAAAIG